GERRDLHSFPTRRSSDLIFAVLNQLANLNGLKGQLINLASILRRTYPCSSVQKCVLPLRLFVCLFVCFCRADVFIKNTSSPKGPRGGLFGILINIFASFCPRNIKLTPTATSNPFLLKYVKFETKIYIITL